MKNLDLNSIRNINKLLGNANFSTINDESLKTIRERSKEFLNSLEIQKPKFSFRHYAVILSNSYLGYMIAFGLIKGLIGIYLIPAVLVCFLSIYFCIVKPLLEYRKLEKEATDLEEYMSKIDEILRFREKVSKKDFVDVNYVNVYVNVKDQRLEYVDYLINSIRNSITLEYEEEFKRLLSDFNTLINQEKIDSAKLDVILKNAEDLYNKVNVPGLKENLDENKKRKRI